MWECAGERWECVWECAGERWAQCVWECAGERWCAVCVGVCRRAMGAVRVGVRLALCVCRSAMRTVRVGVRRSAMRAVRVV